MPVQEILAIRAPTFRRSDSKGEQLPWDSSSSKFVSSEIQLNFLALLPNDPRIERVYWAFEQQILRIWTVVDTPDFQFEKKIYAAQLRFMDHFPELETDFCVIYRFGKSFDRLRPSSAHQILP